ncbi:PKD domain-containing protein [Kutzneria sp. CA-103260]|uniref:PKD domain-containing protein n=1 Tax=Kutzneria sp. CA-103260 TaxID=2802641 RepID=UPI001BA5ACEE|nr:PKD domain-containing protein [Kutzneria sp. CA-103260]QUQ68573.1 Right handed beta helix region [Kutzneria sp. CA-103260]
MRTRAVLASLAAVLGLTTLTTGVAHADGGADLWVIPLGNCWDQGPGTVAQPFCTVQGAAAVAQPGDTVHITGGSWGELDITRSGRPGAPITFLADRNNGFLQQISLGADSHGNQQPHGVTMHGVHDIVVRGNFVVGGTAGPVVIDDSTDVTVDGVQASGPQPGTAPVVDIAGASSRITLSRNHFTHASGPGVAVESGVTGAVVTTNVIRGNLGPGIQVSDSAGAVLTSNTVLNNCLAGISLAGASAGASIENNVLVGNTGLATAGCTTRGAGEIAVAASATAGTTSAYNLFKAANNDLYGWAGTVYSSLDAFTAATGQGAHDLVTDPKFATITPDPTPQDSSPLIDSADDHAPGELATDLTGSPRVDDPLITGLGTHDRGAIEFRDPFKITSYQVTPDQGPYPLPVTATVQASNPWSTPMTYMFDFGDGSAPVVTTTPSASHVYQKPNANGSPYFGGVTVTAPSGVTYHDPANVQVNEPGPEVARLTAYQSDRLEVGIDAGASTDPWKITDYAVDYGDGSAPVHSTYTGGGHTYAVPGTYPVTLTITDSTGATAATTQKVRVGGLYTQDGPSRVLDTRGGGTLGAGGQLSLKVTGANGVPATGVTAVVLNVTATNPTTDSYLTVFPDGQPKPGTSNLNFAAGQTVPNLVTVPVGADGTIDIVNHLGSVDVIADLEGYYADSPATTGHALVTKQPTRVLDTRDSGGPVGPNGTRTLDLSGQLDESPGFITAVLLNVTVTNPTASSYLTAFPDGQPLPGSSNLNFVPGQTTSNLVVVGVSLDGKVDFYNHAGSADVVVDYVGAYSLVDPPTLVGAPFTPLAPSRLLDTREGSGSVGSGESRALRVAGVGGVPADATAVVLNVTVADGTADSYLTVFPGGTARPAVSNLSFGAGGIVQNQVIVPVGADGTIDFFNHLGTVDVIADVFGYFAR